MSTKEAKRMQRMFFAEAALAQAAGESKQARRCRAIGRRWAAVAAGKAAGK